MPGFRPWSPFVEVCWFNPLPSLRLMGNTSGARGAATDLSRVTSRPGSVALPSDATLGTAGSLICSFLFA